MKMLELGRSKISISSIAMGTWQAGKSYWVGVRDEDIISAVHTACDSGINAFDTAEEYGDGYSEQVLGKAVQGRRDRIVLMSKVFSSHLRYEHVIEACERSLKNLKTDYLDLYQIHWPSGSWGTESVPLEESIRALSTLKSQGKIRAIGVSNFSLTQLKEALSLVQVDSIQPPYSLFWRNIEKEIAPFCRDHQITVLAYSPLAQGFLSGKFKVGHQFEKGDNRQDNKLFSKDVFPTVISAVEKLHEFAKTKNISLSQLALAWVTHHQNTAAIAGVRNPTQIRENAKASEINFSEQEIKQIESITWPIAQRFLDDSVPWNWVP